MRFLIVGLMLVCAPVLAGTTVISGTTDIDDSRMRKSGPGNNHGAVPALSMGVLSVGSDFFHSLFRVNNPSTNIPAGEITEVRMIVWRFSGANSVEADTLEIYRVKDINAWGEGDKSATASGTGENSWDDYADPTPWTGSGGCSTAGTDYDTVAGFTVGFAAYTSGDDVQNTFILPNSWATDARDGVQDFSLMLRVNDETETDNLFSIRSTENGSNQPTVEFDTLSGGFQGVNMGGSE